MKASTTANMFIIFLLMTWGLGGRHDKYIERFLLCQLDLTFLRLFLSSSRQVYEGGPISSGNYAVVGRESGGTYCLTTCPLVSRHLRQCAKLCRCECIGSPVRFFLVKQLFTFRRKRNGRLSRTTRGCEILFPVGEIGRGNYRNA